MPPGSDFCARPSPDACDRPRRFAACATADGFRNDRAHLYWDLSRYDGVTFWARRGPDGQPGSVALQDKHTSDALNREIRPFAGASRSAARVPERLACAPDGSDATTDVSLLRSAAACRRRTDPSARPSPSRRCWKELYPLCGPSACASTPATSRRSRLRRHASASSTSSRARKPALLLRQTRRRRPTKSAAGTPGRAPVHLSTDWQLYVIPFSEFRQVGFGKRAPFFDLHSIYMHRASVPGGFRRRLRRQRELLSPPAMRLESPWTARSENA